MSAAKREIGKLNQELAQQKERAESNKKVVLALAKNYRKVSRNRFILSLVIWGFSIFVAVALTKIFG